MLVLLPPSLKCWGYRHAPHPDLCNTANQTSIIFLGEDSANQATSLNSAVLFLR